MKEITIEPYNHENHAQLLYLIERIFPDELIDETIFNEVFLCNPSFNPDHILLSKIEKEPVGFVLAAFDSSTETGYVQLMGVISEYRNHGIGTFLLDSIFRVLGSRTLRFCDYPYSYIIPGLDIDSHAQGINFLEKRGFDIEEKVDAMKLSLKEYTEPKGIKANSLKLDCKGYEICKFKNHMFPNLILFCQKKMQRDWLFTLQKAYNQNRLQKAGYICRHKKTHKIVGFAFSGVVNGDPQRFGPIGVDTAIRGNSVGSILLNSCLIRQKKLLLESSYFLWCNKNTPAWYMYRKAGFITFRTFAILKKR